MDRDISYSGYCIVSAVFRGFSPELLLVAKANFGDNHCSKRQGLSFVTLSDFISMCMDEDHGFLLLVGLVRMGTLKGNFFLADAVY